MLTRFVSRGSRPSRPGTRRRHASLPSPPCRDESGAPARTLVVRVWLPDRPGRSARWRAGSARCMRTSRRSTSSSVAPAGSSTSWSCRCPRRRRSSCWPRRSAPSTASPSSTYGPWPATVPTPSTAFLELAARVAAAAPTDRLEALCRGLLRRRRRRLGRRHRGRRGHRAVRRSTRVAVDPCVPRGERAPRRRPPGQRPRRRDVGAPPGGRDRHRCRPRHRVPSTNASAHASPSSQRSPTPSSDPASHGPDRVVQT